MEKDALSTLYGDNAMQQVVEYMKELKKNSNIPFDEKYVDLSIGFLMLKVHEILDGKESKLPLKQLVSQSFGEAAIYKYNCCNGIL